MKEYIFVYLDSEYSGIIRNKIIDGTKSEAIDKFNKLFPKGTILNIIEK